MVGLLKEIKFKLIDDTLEYLEFINQNKDSNCLLTIAHNPVLGRILDMTFGYKYSFYFVYYKSIKIGVFPIVFINKKSVSMPHFSYGGAFIKKGHEEKLPLVNLSILDNFHNSEIRSFARSSEHVSESKVATFIKLENDEFTQFKKFNSNHRRKIKKSYKNELITNRGGVEFLNHFYNVYSKNMHRLGSPPLPIIFFKNILNNYDHGDKFIYITFYKKEPVGAAFVLSFGGFMEDCWLSTNSSYNKLYVSYQLYWEMIRNAIILNEKYFSFGRSSKESSLHNFKRHWRPIEKTIYFNYSESNKTQLKSLTFLPKLWKLIPIKIANSLGYVISKYIY